MERGTLETVARSAYEEAVHNKLGCHLASSVNYFKTCFQSCSGGESWQCSRKKKFNILHSVEGFRRDQGGIVAVANHVCMYTAEGFHLNFWQQSRKKILCITRAGAVHPYFGNEDALKIYMHKYICKTFMHACGQGVYKQMVEAFRSLGVETVAGVGTPFDPEFHEAIMREERDDIPDGTVLKEFRRGFRLGSQLLRAAMVQASFLQPFPRVSCFFHDVPESPACMSFGMYLQVKWRRDAHLQPRQGGVLAI